MNVRFTILLVLLVVVVGGLVGVTQVLRSDSSSDRDPRLYRVSRNQLANVTVTRGANFVTFVQNEGKWTIQGNNDEEAYPVDEERWSGIPTLLLGPVVQRTLSDGEDETPELAEFGLADPANRLILATASGAKLAEVHLGNRTPTGDGYYAKVENENTLYIVNSSWADIVIRLVTQPPYPLELEPAASVN